MKSFPADLRLPFQSREIEMGELLVVRVLAGYNKSLHCLGKQKLMMEWYKSTLILERKNNPDSHRT